MIGKFRAWSITGKRMYSWEQIIQNPQMMYKFLLWPDVYIPMWWTGLTDRNDVEIYEKDIVLIYVTDYDFSGKLNKVRIPAVVEYVKDEACFYSSYVDASGNTRYHSLINAGEVVEVIGDAFGGVK